MKIFGLEEASREGADEPETEPSLFSLLKLLFKQGEVVHTLPKRTKTFREGNYTFKVSLHPDCWRKLQLPSSATLLDLHNWIQDAFDFDDDHLYSFFMNGKPYSKHKYNSPMDIVGPYVHETEIGQQQLQEKQ